MQPEELLEDLQRQEKELRAVLQDLEGKFQLKFSFQIFKFN